MNSQQKIFESALLFDGDGGARNVTEDEVGRWNDKDGVLWLDIDLTHARAKKWLLGDSKIDSTTADILLAGDTRPRSLTINGGQAITLRGINMNPGAVPDDMVAVRIWMDRKRIITSHRRDLLSIDDVHRSLMDNKGPSTSGGFLVAIVSRLSERIETAVDNIIQLVESVETEITRGDTGELRSSLSVIRRQAAAIKRYLAPQREALDRLVRSDSTLFSSQEMMQLREEGDTLTRHLEDLELAREQALVAQEELMNRFAQEQNSRMYLLSVVAAIFLPLSFLTGLFGMNLAGLPGTEDPNSFLYAGGLMIACGFGLMGFFKWKKWI